MKGHHSHEAHPIWNRPDDTKYHAHFDCFSGAAGDMMLAACVDATADGSTLLQYIQFCLEQGMPALKGEFSLATKRVWRSQTGSIAANYLIVKSKYEHAAAPVPQPSSSNSSHGHEHHHHAADASVDNSGNSRAQKDNSSSDAMSHGHSHAHDSNSGHGHDHHHAHPSGGEGTEAANHDHSHAHHDDNDGPLRNLPQIRKLLEDASIKYIPQWVKDMAIAAFTELAKAEALTHGAASSDSVHFHEVGAVDSIVDTVGTCLALYCLGVTTVSCSRLPLGEGTVWTDHGLLPVPAPATLRLLVGMPTCPGPPGITGELVTPTAAALLKVLTTLAPGASKIPGRPPCFTIRKIGIGAGTKDFVKHPNILRLLLGDQVLADGR